jgi:hypothetical protein
LISGRTSRHDNARLALGRCDALVVAELHPPSLGGGYAIAADHGEEVAVHVAAAMAIAALKAIDAACPNTDFLVSGL